MKGLRRIDDDLIVDYGDGDSITISHYFNSQTFQINQFRFADGKTLTGTELLVAYPIVLLNAGRKTFTDASETIHAGTGNDAIYGKGGDDVIDGDAGDDVLYGDTGDDMLSGGMGNDKLDGGDGNDILTGGKGNDTLDGGAGDNIYQFSTGDGQDTVSYSRIVEVVFTDVRADAVKGLRRVNDDLIVDYGNGDSITFSYYFPRETCQIQFRFADGKTLTATELLAAYPIVLGNPGHKNFTDVSETIHAGIGTDIINGGGGDDVIDGDAGDDFLDGGRGNDVLTGGIGDDYLDGSRGNDTYQFSTGDGQDTICNEDYGTDDDGGGRTDVIVFTDVNADALNGLRCVDDDLIVDYGNGDSITISHYFSSAVYQINEFRFADGKTLTGVQLLATYPIQLTDDDDDLRFTAASETIHAGAGNDRIFAGAGNDVIDGDAGDDQLSGGAGNDKLTGGAGDDLLYGDVGNDYLEGGTGNDTYLLRTGSGHDTIFNNDSSAQRCDGLMFYDVASTGLTAVKWLGDDLVLEYGTADSVTVKNYFFSKDYQLDAFEFADGVTLTSEQLLAAYPIQLAESADLQQVTRSAVAGVGDITATGDNEVTAQQGAADKLVTAAQGAEAVGAANVAPAANPAFHYDGLRTHDGTPVYMDENNMYYPRGNQPKTEGNLIAETYFPKRKAPEKPDYDNWFTCSKNVRPLVAQRAAEAAAHAIQVAQRANGAQGMGAAMADHTHDPDQQKTAATTSDQLEKNPVTPSSKGLILSPWLMAKYVMDYHLKHSDAAALGGEIAEMHAAQSSGASLTPASGMLAAPHFDLHGKKTRH